MIDPNNIDELSVYDLRADEKEERSLLTEIEKLLEQRYDFPVSELKEKMDKVFDEFSK